MPARSGCHGRTLLSRNHRLPPANQARSSALFPHSNVSVPLSRMVWHDGELWLSDYSSHEGKASIYLARLKVVR